MSAPQPPSAATPPNPPVRVAPTPTARPHPGRQVAVLLLAVVMVLVVGAVLATMQLTWGELWWQHPRGWFNTPRLIAYGSVLVASILYAVLGRLVTRGAAYWVGLALTVLGSALLCYVWFIVSLFTGLGL